VSTHVIESPTAATTILLWFTLAAVQTRSLDARLWSSLNSHSCAVEGEERRHKTTPTATAVGVDDTILNRLRNTKRCADGFTAVLSHRT
jgi:hypothetical protein